MSRDFAMLLEHLRTKTGDVELDVPAPQGNGDAATVARLARAREVAIRRGDRVAYLYKLVDGRRAAGSNGAAQRPDLSTSVTETECQALVAAGATWIGPAELAPVPRPYIERLRVREFSLREAGRLPVDAVACPDRSQRQRKEHGLDALRTFSSGDPELNEVTAFSGGNALTSLASALFQHSAKVEAEEAESNPRLQQSSRTITSLEPHHFGLPSGAESLRAWLATAHDVLARLVHGRLAP
jgi:hypothetical protein